MEPTGIAPAVSTSGGLFLHHGLRRKSPTMPVAHFWSVRPLCATEMSHDDFTQRAAEWRRIARPLALVWIIYMIVGPIFLFDPLERSIQAHFEHSTALSVTSVLVCVSIALPPCLGLWWQSRRGLACERCGCTREFIRGVIRDGRCPRCKIEVLDPVA